MCPSSHPFACKPRGVMIRCLAPAPFDYLSLFLVRPLRAAPVLPLTHPFACKPRGGMICLPEMIFNIRVEVQLSLQLNKR